MYQRFVRITQILIIVLTSGVAWGLDNKELLDKLHILAFKGNAEAEYHIGMMFNNGIGTEKDLKKALEWFQKSGDHGNPLGAYKLGCYYGGQAGSLLKIDDEKALKYKSIAAEAGYSLAQHDVGIILYKKKEYKAASKYWEMAALQGEAKSTYFLMTLYNDGFISPKNNSLIYAYFKLSQLFSRGQITENATKTLGELAAKMTKGELEAAEKIVTNWQVKKTTLTQKATQGLDAAKELISK